MWNTADHADVFTARSPFTTGAQRQAVLSLWKRIQAGKDAFLSVERTVLITGEKLAEAIASLRPFLELTELQNYRNIANAQGVTLNRAVEGILTQRNAFDMVRALFPTIPREGIVARFSVLFYCLLL